MRIDKYLKVARVIKRRTIAKEVLDGGLILINGKVAKPSTEVKIGDELILHLGERTLTIKISNVMMNSSKKDAGSMFEIINDEVIKSTF